MNAIVYELNLIRIALQVIASTMALGVGLYVIVEAIKADRR